MSGERLLSFANRWFTTSVGVTVAILLLSVLTGFVLLPYASPDSRLTGLWDSICSAAGFPVRRSAGDVIAPDFAVSSAKLNETILRNPPAESIGRGATLAQQCAICHGPTGISRADSPNLAGQYAAVIYKQLHDFKTGARVNTVMSPFAIHMSEQDMLDLAAYYSYLPRLPKTDFGEVVPIPAIVASGAPMRGIAPCGSCHGGIENKTGSPWLNGQPAVYVKAQLHAFATDARRNDTSQQMRNIARAMTDDEIEAAARFLWIVAVRSMKMERLRIDHVKHGRALLAMRLPRIRPYLARPHLAEVCEAYSLAVLRLDSLRRENAPNAAIDEYEDLRQSIENEIRFYMLQSGRRTA